MTDRGNYGLELDSWLRSQEATERIVSEARPATRGVSVGDVVIDGQRYRVMSEVDAENSQLHHAPGVIWGRCLVPVAEGEGQA